MPRKPLYISMRKIEIYERHNESLARMEAGGPGPMEELFQMSEREKKHQKELRTAFQQGLKMERGGW
jgi:hypothetical protein